jgi:hypothetical protein
LRTSVSLRADRGDARSPLSSFGDFLRHRHGGGRCGLVSNSDLKGEIHVFVQANTDQCTTPGPTRACSVLRRAGAESVLGPKPPEGGGFGPGGSGVEGGRPYVLCTYTGLKGLGVLNIDRTPS